MGDSRRRFNFRDVMNDFTRLYGDNATMNECFWGILVIFLFIWKQGKKGRKETALSYSH